jgi:arylsulfatase A
MKIKTCLPAIFLSALVIVSCRKAEPLQVNASSVDLNTAVLSKPNIILILGDDVGYEIPNYTGGESYSTPNLNYLAAHGTQFTQCHASPLCSPSRCMLLTAKYNFRNYTTWGVLDTSQRTIANLLQSKGYATCMAGKWQFDGGDASIKKFGFQKYLVTNPFLEVEGDPKVKIYKDPMVYENGAYWPADSVKGKYGEDLFRDYMFNFIDDNKSKKPFFIYWAMNLVHPPFSPTPDDPQFATWNSSKKMDTGDTIYYPSMVKYMDKLIGQLNAKLKADNLQNNTLILFLGDNGTAAGLHSLFKGQIVTGAKSSPTEEGTHVPMLAYLPGKILPGIVDSSLISIVDFMPSIADVAKTSIPASYGTTDGISFTPQFLGDYSNVRPWIFCHYIGAGKFETNPKYLRRWMQNDTYKQYDSLPNKLYSKKFYNIRVDPLEEHVILPGNMTPQEKLISKQYLQNMQQLH